MALELHPLTLSDFLTLSTPSTSNPLSHGLIGMPTPLCSPITTALAAKTLSTFHFTHQKSRFISDPTVRYMKVSLPSSSSDNEIISIARWHYYPDGYDVAKEAHWELHPIPTATATSAPTRTPSSVPEGFNLPLHNHILSTRDQKRSSWIPPLKPCWILMHMVTHPSHRGKGAAGMLVRWGIEQAEREGVSVYLEAGVLGRPLYERFGFGEVGELRVDLRGVGGEGLPEEVVMCLMVYEPKTKGRGEMVREAGGC